MEWIVFIFCLMYIHEFFIGDSWNFFVYKMENRILNFLRCNSISTWSWKKGFFLKILIRENLDLFQKLILQFPEFLIFFSNVYIKILSVKPWNGCGVKVGSKGLGSDMPKSRFFKKFFKLDFQIRRYKYFSKIGTIKP